MRKPLDMTEFFEIQRGNSLIKRVSGIGSALELIFQNENEDFLSSKTPGNRIVWKTWKSQGILFWNFRGHPVKLAASFTIMNVIVLIGAVA